MPRYCVKAVHKPCITLRKTCVHLPTAAQNIINKLASKWVTHRLSTYTTHLNTTWLSTALLRKTPLFEHYLYLVSTGPTTIITKEIN